MLAFVEAVWNTCMSYMYLCHIKDNLYSCWGKINTHSNDFSTHVFFLTELTELTQLTQLTQLTELFKQYSLY